MVRTLLVFGSGCGLKFERRRVRIGLQEHHGESMV